MERLALKPPQLLAVSSSAAHKEALAERRSALSPWVGVATPSPRQLPCPTFYRGNVPRPARRYRPKNLSMVALSAVKKRSGVRHKSLVQRADRAKKCVCSYSTIAERACPSVRYFCEVATGKGQKRGGRVPSRRRVRLGSRLVANQEVTVDFLDNRPQIPLFIPHAQHFTRIGIDKHRQIASIGHSKNDLSATVCGRTRGELSNRRFRISRLSNLNLFCIG